MTDQERILSLENTLRIIKQAYVMDVLCQELIKAALEGEAVVPLPSEFEPRDYVAVNLLSLLEAFPEANTGDWYGQLKNWCRGIIAGAYILPRPNVGPEEIRARIVEPPWKY